jgi:GT2 family glycosyltransferase
MQRSFPARPFVSFVLATYNRGPVVLDCLKQTLNAALTALGKDRFNIIVIDNASTDNTADLIATLAAEQPRVILIRNQSNCGPVAKNIGLHKNPADILVLLDDDAYPLPGALTQMVRHFEDDPLLGAAVFDVTLPDGRKEASAYPDVFIGAGTALRGAALRGLSGAQRPGRGLLPADFFMQAEEYDLSFRLLAADWSIQRFWDMPLLHLKAPNARIGTRTTRLDVRNNLWLLARYIPEPLCHQFAADWLARYWRMAVQREAGGGGAHKAAFLRGAAEGFSHWNRQRGTDLLSSDTIERIFKFNAIRERLRRVQQKYNLKTIAFGDWGKNLLAFTQATGDLNLQVSAIIDSNLANDMPLEYRGIPLLDESAFRNRAVPADAIIVTALSRVHAERRAGAFRRLFQLPVIDLFGKASVAASTAGVTSRG